MNKRKLFGVCFCFGVYIGWIWFFPFFATSSLDKFIFVLVGSHCIFVGALIVTTILLWSLCNVKIEPKTWIKKFRNWIKE